MSATNLPSTRNMYQCSTPQPPCRTADTPCPTAYQDTPAAAVQVRMNTSCGISSGAAVVQRPKSSVRASSFEVGARGVSLHIYAASHAVGLAQGAASAMRRLRACIAPPADNAPGGHVAVARWHCGRDGEHDGAGAPLHACARRRRVGVDFERRTRRSGDGVRCGEYDSGRLLVDASGGGAEGGSAARDGTGDDTPPLRLLPLYG
ncbi:hypothetical protein HYPSUDRAFT_209056 [Hypholoma sublateritium FD-334 SS-4]|uniref:Uncharacterized protein n=1 Tax=Hypholoma sublateritium (strain FD-334 SS-4) TaxID=945553 RepID=A0A0D2P015_HYPSF|nr:hypothetical protein HYPSUDRAFT_209056 [Hypholoma sublateritium FD-334 SS-4]